MRILLGEAVLELVKGDITLQEVDAIVTAANSRLAGGGGVDGAIHEEGGATIIQELARNYPSGCPTGDAVITRAGLLKAKFVIHAVGPVYLPHDRKWSADRLSKAYQNSFRLAVEQGCHSIAFPAISTGVYHYPAVAAAQVALRTARDFLSDGAPLELVRWVLYNDLTFDAFVDAAREIFGELAEEHRSTVGSP